MKRPCSSSIIPQSAVITYHPLHPIRPLTVARDIRDTLWGAASDDRRSGRLASRVHDLAVSGREEITVEWTSNKRADTAAAPTLHGAIGPRPA